MASFINANLPSDDEDDEDFAPKESRAPKRAARPGYRSRPGAAVADAQEAKGNDADSAPEDDPQRLAKKAKVDELWRKLNSGPAGSGAAGAATSSKPLSWSQMCKPADKAKQSSDAVWMRSLGMLPKASSKPAVQPGQQAGASTSASHPEASTPAPAASTSAAAAAAAAADAKSVAAAALAAVQSATGSAALGSSAKVAITETRRFAGQDIKVVKQVDKGSKEAQAAAEKLRPTSSGLDAMLAAIEKKKKVSVLDKSAMDWQEYKKSDTAVEEELETYKKSGDKYLEKVSFLQRAELREYERERDQRLASDVRTRGRL